MRPRTTVERAIADLEALAPRPPKAPEQLAAERERQLEALARFEEYMADRPQEAPRAAVEPSNTEHKP